MNRVTVAAPGPIGGLRETIENARAALTMAAAALRRDDLSPPRRSLAPDEVLAALAAAEAALCRDLRSAPVPAQRRLHLATALVHLGQVRVAIRETEAARWTVANRELSAHLDRLRSIVTMSELIEAVPKALADLGFSRAMVSQVSQHRWFVLSSHVHDNPEQAAQMTEVGRRAARLVDPRLVEYDMFTQRQPILIPDAPGNGRVHPELLSLTGVRSYVGAPIVLDTGVAGFVHADRTIHGRTVSPADAMLLAAMGEVLAFALEKAVLSRRLRRIAEMAQETDEELMFRVEQAGEAGGNFAAPPGPASPVTGEALSPRLRQLSSRELEVLRHLAAGANNTSIALRMGIAETTVKTHVKHVLRKTGAANRAEAAAIYLRPSG